jgi:uncharacterized membrane protein
LIYRALITGTNLQEQTLNATWALAIALHQLGTIIWIGGMFFAHVALRPAVNELLDPPQRFPLMLSILGRFFRWVWVAILLLWGSGLWIFLGLYEGKAGLYVHAMMGIAGLMTVFYLFLWSVPYRRMRAAVAAEDWAAAAARLGMVRPIILVNLILGLVTAAIGAAGPKL